MTNNSSWPTVASRIYSIFRHKAFSLSVATMVTYHEKTFRSHAAVDQQPQASEDKFRCFHRRSHSNKELGSSHTGSGKEILAAVSLTSCDEEGGLPVSPVNSLINHDEVQAVLPGFLGKTEKNLETGAE